MTKTAEGDKQAKGGEPKEETKEENANVGGAGTKESTEKSTEVSGTMQAPQADEAKPFEDNGEKPKLHWLPPQPRMKKKIHQTDADAVKGSTKLAGKLCILLPNFLMVNTSTILHFFLFWLFLFEDKDDQYP
jgi:hypothetical protein